MADGKLDTHYVTQKDNDKWVEFEFAAPKQIGCIEFVNENRQDGNWKDLIDNYRVQCEKEGSWIDMATVTINGKLQVVWWNPPLVGDITDALKPGSNIIEIAVINSWHNLLVGDEQFPADFEWGVDRSPKGRMMKGYPDWFLKNQPRPEQNRKGFVVWYYHRQDTPLQPAGLVGPVNIVVKSTVTAIPLNVLN